jgi:hypothetical protein
MTRTILAGGLIAVLALPVAAQDSAANRLPLSQIIANLEAEADFDRIDEIDWDDGRWKVEYYLTDGREIEVEIDPVTGEVRRDD